MLHVVQWEQLGGSPIEDLNLHISNFLQLCDTNTIKGASEDAIKLRLLPFSLRDKAKCLLQSQPQGSISTWKELVNKFLTKFFTPSKLAKIRSEITSFIQLEEESLYDTWESSKISQDAHTTRYQNAYKSIALVTDLTQPLGHW